MYGPNRRTTRLAALRLYRCSQLLIVSLLGTLSLFGCHSGDPASSFAGYTYGGGGKTYSSEPAKLVNRDDRFELQAGHPSEESFLHFVVQHSSQETGLELPVVEGRMKVDEEDSEAVIVSGFVVIQSRVGGLTHGSFDLEATDGEGRKKMVVGSFSAEELPRPQEP